MKISSVVHNPMEHTAVNMQLRSYFVQVYRFMFLGLILSAVCAWLGAQPFMIAKLYSIGENGHTTLSFFGLVVCLAPFLLVFKLHADARALKPRTATFTFYMFAALMGLSLSSIFLVYAPGTIFTTFLICAVMFGLLSLYGQTTSRDLSSIGSVLFMGVVGLVVAMVVNMFLQNEALDYAICLIGVGTFTAMTAHDTQRIRRLYSESYSDQQTHSVAIVAALSLYLDFVNIFLFLLRLLGGRRQ